MRKILLADSHSSGIFTEQCSCKFSQILGISVMLECEGISIALSVILSRFKLLPCVCCHENACIILQSINVRVLRVNEKYYYKSHTCKSVCDLDSYLSCTQHNTSGTEFINQI